MKLAAVGDLCCETGHVGYWRPRLAPVNTEADVLLLAGDLTRGGELGELDVLLQELQAVAIPIVAVLGDRDYEAGRARVILERLRRAGIATLEGGSTTIGSATVVGAVGVEGGFDATPPRRWSYAERQLMARLEHYLANVDPVQRVVLLHYAPIQPGSSTDDPDEIAALGSSCMAVAIDTAGAELVLHAHAADGRAEGRTAQGTPVFNIALPVLERLGYSRPYRIFDL